MKWFGKKKEKEPCELTKAYIAALMENPERTRLSRWEQLKYEIMNSLDSDDKQWLLDMYNDVVHEFYMVQIAQYRLTGEADKETANHISDSKITASTYPNQVVQPYSHAQSQGQAYAQLQDALQRSVLGGSK